jgi:hypothetical protein
VLPIKTVRAVAFRLRLTDQLMFEINNLRDIHARMAQLQQLVEAITGQDRETANASRASN